MGRHGVAADIAREFYDWQFQFRADACILSNRSPLRTKCRWPRCARYWRPRRPAIFIGIFSGAAQNWGVAYFEDRLNVGWLHDQIDLPFKWYIGSYAEMQRLVRIYLHRDFKGPMAAQAEEAIFKVFNYDMQAIGDSFLLNTSGIDGSQYRSHTGNQRQPTRRKASSRSKMPSTC